ncbi:hypothetical protein BHE74_00024893 [Ensete ventricosum]|nr:hypothetical protein BHE74_00024893 [Ensete ventricosum]
MSEVSIGFSYTASKIQNTGHSRRISPCFVSIGFSCTISEITKYWNSQRISP